MVKVIGVRFKSASKIYFFDPGEFDVQPGEGVIVETTRGIEYGEVVNGPQQVEVSDLVVPLKQILRIADESDRNMVDQNSAKQKDAFAICEEKIAAHKLDMKLVDVEYSFNGSKITFYFTADGRVDFRELVKDLASVFRTRIELRQIGVRDEARMIGGLGGCGRVVCCKQFLGDFHPVSIKMAKEQSLSLSPTKISGICGRLMCCLKYEQETYEQLRKQMPRVGRDVLTPDGHGVVVSNQVIAERAKVRITLPDGTMELREYPIAQIERAPQEGFQAPHPPRAETPPPEREAHAAPEAEESASGETPEPPFPDGDEPKRRPRPPRRRPHRRPATTS